MLTNAQYNRLVDTCTYRQLLDLGEMMGKIGKSIGYNTKSAYPCNWLLDDETFLQIAYAAILVLDLALPE